MKLSQTRFMLCGWQTIATVRELYPKLQGSRQTAIIPIAFKKLVKSIYRDNSLNGGLARK